MGVKAIAIESEEANGISGIKESNSKRSVEFKKDSVMNEDLHYGVFTLIYSARLVRTLLWLQNV